MGLRSKGLLLAALSVALTAGACRETSTGNDRASRVAGGGQGNTSPSKYTRRVNRAVAADLLLQDPSDFEDAERGFIDRDPALVIRAADGHVVWDTTAYAFEEDGEAPDSVNPSLWRQARLNNHYGLFKVTEGIYQVRGYDLANMSIIEGHSGWIIVDPLTSKETAAAALALARKHLGEAPIVAVILTHSHIDHFGGIAAVVSAEDVAEGRVRIFAPRAFLDEATSENVLAGLAMGRRATFMYGFALERGVRGHVDSGLGKSPARGSSAILAPTDVIDRTPQRLDIDGIRFVFQHVPDSEAPAELTFYMPDARAFCGAEIVSHNMHNLYTLRGARVRNGLQWSGYIHEAIELFGDAEVLFASHHWPTWGNAKIRDYLTKQRDVYKYIHDQTLRLANAGFTSSEIAESLELPASLSRSFAERGYYGTLRHNAKAVYQRYFGWYDGNPAHLDPLPPAEAGAKYIEFMGGADEVMRRVGGSIARGEYRWAAMVLDHLVFAEPNNTQAREMLAGVYDQLGYQAESAPWRDVYLTGALELRQGSSGSALDLDAAIDLLRNMPVSRFFDSMAVRINGREAEGKKLTLNFVFTDLGLSYVLRVENSVLTYREAAPDPDADVTLKLTREFWLRLVVGRSELRELLFSDELDVDGSRLALLSFFSLMDKPHGDFSIVTP